MSAEPARAAVQAVDERQLVGLLQEMVRIRSYSAGGEEGAIARFVQGYVRDLGLESELQEVEPGRYNVISRWRGTGGGTSLMLNGHLDTNPAGEGWTKDPLGGDVDDRFIYGIGVSNMKAADAAYIAAVRAVRDAGIRLRGDVVLAHVIGELQGGVGTVHMLGQGVRADRFIVGEPTDLALLDDPRRLHGGRGGHLRRDPPPVQGRGGGRRHRPHDPGDRPAQGDDVPGPRQPGPPLRAPHRDRGHPGRPRPGVPGVAL